MRRKIFGLALSGGSLRGAAHIGVLKVLEREGLRPDFISGTSAGGLVAGLYAAGLPITKIEQEAKNLKKQNLIDLNVKPMPVFFNRLCCKRSFDIIPSGFIKGYLIEKALELITKGKKFHELDLPIAIVSTDIKTGEEVVFCSEDLVPKQSPEGIVYITNASLAEAIRASISIPGIFVPKKIEDRLLVDGGIKDNVPAGVLKNKGADVVVAVDLKFASQEDKKVSNIFEILIQTMDIMGQEISDLKTQQYADLVIDPGLYDVNLTDIHMIPYCIKKGFEAAEKALVQIKNLVYRY